MSLVDPAVSDDTMYSSVISMDGYNYKSMVMSVCDTVSRPLTVEAGGPSCAPLAAATLSLVSPVSQCGRKAATLSQPPVRNGQCGLAASVAKDYTNVLV